LLLPFFELGTLMFLTVHCNVTIQLAAVAATFKLGTQMFPTAQCMIIQLAAFAATL